ncbi:hypothetical protein ACFV9C_41570 [Kribbella sp. NPDC059898]|uniref:hypothetical protein n=1 Tax=Kribbella sp. NPDC059898 TaxID=3346995 RepID=UPI00365ED645
MQIKTLEELQSADERSLAFTPLGLGHMEAADAAEFQQQVVKAIEISSEVAASTRDAFERLRTVYAHGVLCYETYTLVHDHALLLVEHALRDRLLEHYNHRIPLVDKRGQTILIEADDYETVIQACRRTPSLLVGDNGPILPFRGMLSHLTGWARCVGYFRGQQNRHQEQTLGDLRNMVAHGSADLTSPVSAASELRAAAEIINQLWGYPTPNGKYYPAPRPRHILAIGWAGPGNIQVVDAHRLADEPGLHRDRNYVIVRAVADDPDLFDFDSRYEQTAYEAEWLWGPGSVDDAAAWMLAESPVVDERDHLDRVFAIRSHAGYLEAPQRPEIAINADPAGQAGEWFVVRADFPAQARVHVRNRLTTEHCQESGACDTCAAELLAHGTYHDVREQLSHATTRTIHRLPPDVTVPSHRAHRRTPIR